jgi:hypothetical protein
MEARAKDELEVPHSAPVKRMLQRILNGPASEP